MLLRQAEDRLQWFQLSRSCLTCKLQTLCRNFLQPIIADLARVRGADMMLENELITHVCLPNCMC
jgi:hypothetical protein